MVCAMLSCTGALTFVDLIPPNRRLPPPEAAKEDAAVGFAFVVFTSGSYCFSS